MPAEFYWTPSLGSPLEAEPRVLRAQFGDNYAAVGGDGLNPIVDVWQLEFRDVSVTVAGEIDAFLRTKAGVTPFSFVPPKPHDTEIQVRSEGKWGVDPSGGLLRNVRVTLRRVYTP